MDKMDNQILAALRADARASLSTLAAQLGLSRATVRARINKMVARGDIAGFSVLTRADVQQDPVRGLMMIGIEGRGTEKIIRALQGFAETRAIHSTNGRWDIIVEIGTQTLEGFDAALSRIRRLDGIVASETSLLLSTRTSGLRPETSF